MNNYRNSLQIVVRISAILLLAVLITASAEAQTHENPSDATNALAVKPRFRFLLPPISFGALSSTNIRASGGAGSNVNPTPTVSAGNLPGLGGGTLGRLSKWTGLTSSNSVIGDTTIFEDKFGNVGIGTDSPTSKLTVAGTIQASGGSSILHDMTLQGSGTTASPLGVALPLQLNGPGGIFGIIRAINTTDGGFGVFATGGDSNTSFAGAGLVGHGGHSNTDSGGLGVFALGGSGRNGGEGVFAEGGVSIEGIGGDGLSGKGGNAFGAGHRGGNGITASAGVGVDGATNGLAGDFKGDVKVSGTVNLGGNGELFAPGGEENLRIIRGAVDPAGNVLQGSGFTVQQGQRGEYTINFNTPFSGVPVVTISADVGFAHITCTASTCSVLTLNTIPNLVSRAFNFIAAGPR